MRSRLGLLLSLGLSACRPPEAASAGAAPLPTASVGKPTMPAVPPPAGAVREASGYWTIVAAPPSPPPPAEPPRPPSARTLYAEIAGVSNEEAERRRRAQEALRPEMVRLVETLRRREKGNFLEAELVHRPDWAFLLYFRREPERTLARYTRHPRFRAVRGGIYTQEELQALTRPWVERLQSERLVTGYGINLRLGRLDVDMVVSEAEFLRISAARGWGSLPATLHMTFAAEPVGPAVEEGAGEGVRLFPQDDRNLGIIHMAAFSGRIVLRDGCFRVEQGLPGGDAMLAYFPREVGLYRDAQGYLALRSRTGPQAGRHLGRIGERFTWAGPIAASEELPMVGELRRRCGNAPLMRFSVAEAESLLHARYPHLRTPVPPPPPPGPPARN
jgi:hypothetical protein